MAPHALMLEYGAFSHSIDFVTTFKENLNLEGHPKGITDSKVTAFLLNVLILPFGGVASVRPEPAKQDC